MSAKDDLASIMEKHPTLNDFGFGVPLQTLNKYKESYLHESRRSLLDSEPEFIKVCEWLSQIKMTKAINMKHTSYGLKHIAEKEVGYISNGLFIAAAIHSGFQFQISGPNARFNMSEKSIQEICKRVWSVYS